MTGRYPGARRPLLLVLALIVLPLLAGCGATPAEKIAQADAAGDKALAEGRADEAVDRYQRAMQVVARSGGHFDDAQLTRARESAAEEARTALRRARDSFATNPGLARDFSERAVRLASPEYGGDATTAVDAQKYLDETVRPQIAEQRRLADARLAATLRSLKTAAVMDDLDRVQEAARDWGRDSSAATGFADPWLLKSRVEGLRQALRDDSNELDPAMRGAMSIALISLEGAVARVEIWRRATRLPFDRKLELMSEVRVAVSNLTSASYTREEPAAPAPAGVPGPTVSTGTGTGAGSGTGIRTGTGDGTATAPRSGTGTGTGSASTPLVTVPTSVTSGGDRNDPMAGLERRP